MPNTELTHYGILGMRWGVRRSKAQLARARGSGARRKVSKEEYEAAKKKAINSGDTKTVRAWKDHLTDDELRKALNRVDLNQKLTGYEEKGKKSGLEAVEDVMNKVGRVTNIVNTGLNAYGVIAKINNTFNSKQLPVIDGVDYRKKKADLDKKEEREAAKAKQDEAKSEREAAQEQRAAKRAKDEETISKLAAIGDWDTINKNFGTYDPEAIKNVQSALEKKETFEKWVAEQKKKKQTNDQS